MNLPEKRFSLQQASNQLIAGVISRCLFSSMPAIVFPSPGKKACKIYWTKISQIPWFVN
jgi:hypothetical protein